MGSFAPNAEIIEPLILECVPMDANSFYDCFGQHMVSWEIEPGCCRGGGRLRKTWEGRVIDKSIRFPIEFPIPGPESESGSGSGSGSRPDAYRPHFYCAGFRYPGNHIAAAFFVDNNVGFYRVSPASAMISFRFSGCYMAKFVDQSSGCTYVCHITSKGGRADEGDCRRFWNDFVRTCGSQIANVVVFKPVSIGDRIYARLQELRSRGSNCYTICGLIDSDDRCYVLLMDIYTCKVHESWLEEVDPLSDGLIPE